MEPARSTRRHSCVTPSCWRTASRQSPGSSTSSSSTRIDSGAGSRGCCGVTARVSLLTTRSRTPSRRCAGSIPTARRSKAHRSPRHNARLAHPPRLLRGGAGRSVRGAFLVSPFEADVPSTLPRVRVSFLVPAYNEAATIVDLLERVAALDLEKQIVIVDDGSTDGTGELADEWSKDRSD